MFQEAADAAKVPGGSCSLDGHKWQISLAHHEMAVTRLCLRCNARQQATTENSTVLTTHGCGEDRGGHSWIRTSQADRRCDACGEQRSFIDTPSNPRWVTWLAIGGVVGAKALWLSEDDVKACAEDGHDWQLGIGAPAIVRHCRRCGDRQEAMAESISGCVRVEGHDWATVTKDA